MNAVSIPNLLQSLEQDPADESNSQNQVAIESAINNALSILMPMLEELVRRSVDGTVSPLLVDYTNSRVIIGGISASASPATAEVATGDLKVVSGGSGVILASRDGTKFGRLVLENVDAQGNLQLSVDPL